MNALDSASHPVDSVAPVVVEFTGSGVSGKGNEMAIIDRPEPAVFEATSDELRDALRAVLNRVGLTYGELRALAEAQAFESEAQRRAWAAVRGLEDLLA